MRIERFFSRKLGFDFCVGPSDSFKTWIAIWYTRRIDCGIAIGDREIRWKLS